MKKVVFGITSLTLGGAETVLVDLVNSLKDKNEITILTLYPKGELESQIEDKVKKESIYSKPYCEMSFWEKKKVSIQLLFAKKKLYQKKIQGRFDTEIAFLEGPITRLFSKKNSKTIKIAWIHSDITRIFGNSVIAKIKSYYDKKQYQQYKKIIFVSQDSLNSFHKKYPQIPTQNLQVIYNYIDVNKVLTKAKQEPKSKWNQEMTNLLVVARLVPEKGLDRLLHVHMQLWEKGIQHHVYIIGEGPERKHLQELIQKVGKESTFILLGKKENPYPDMKQADIFCLPSYHEGYGMVLEEAKILNKYIVITDTAAREALNQYPNTCITPNTEDGLYQCLARIIQEKKYAQIQIQEYTTNQSILTQIQELVGE